MADVLNATLHTLQQIGQSVAVSPWSVAVFVVLLLIAWRLTHA